MKKVTRLIDQFKPEHYKLQLTINKEAMTFSGVVSIEGSKVGRPTRRLTFHQKELKITKATLIKHGRGSDENIDVDRINLQRSYDEVRLHTVSPLYPGNYTATLEFSGKITRPMNGIYPCFFTKDGKEDTLIATQFESHHAREAFPCIDEPAGKATFDLSLVTAQGLVVLGNTPTKEQKKLKDLLITTFETSPKMSPYLLAFVIGGLHSKSTKTKNGTEVSVWASVAQPANSFDFALNVAKKSNEFFEDYFGVPYPLAKSDHVALPDFSSGAMENWGLITYREQALLAYPEQTAQSTKELITMVVAHETSHQWFGNLVTMAWWDDLWLNESFANMMEYQASDALFPAWNMWDIFIASDGLAALRRDSTAGVQPVHTDVTHPDEISTLFDPSIVYAKGGRLLYMLKNYIGEEEFREGLSAYFLKHSYGNTTGADLWKALGETSKRDIEEFMTPWLQQSGFPVISVIQEENSLKLHQEHFLSDSSKSDKNRVWSVPLFSDRDDVPDLLSTRSVSVELEDSEYVLVNKGARGHYIVHYKTPAHREAIISKIKAGEMSVVDRLMFLYSNTMLARANYLPYADVLSILAAYEHESEESVWEVIATVLGEVKRFIDHDTSLETHIKTLTRKLITEQYARLGWNERADESTSDQKLRATMISLGAYAEEPAIVAEALRLYEMYKHTPAEIPAELRSIVFSVAVRHKAPEALNYLIEQYEQSQNADLQGDIAAALNSTKDPQEAEILLARLTDPQKIKPQDADRSLFQLLMNRYTRSTAWEWMVANWEWVRKTYESDKSFDNFPRIAASACNTREWQEKYKEHFAPLRKHIALNRNITIGMGEIEDRVTWLERDLAGVKSWFASQQ